jgi:hypothetical protein
MRDINEVLRKKEADLQQLQKEIDALRIAARLLSAETEAAISFTRPAAATSSYPSPTRPAPPAAATTPEAGYKSSWDAAAKTFP